MRTEKTPLTKNNYDLWFNNRQCHDVCVIPICQLGLTEKEITILKFALHIHKLSSSNANNFFTAKDIRDHQWRTSLLKNSLNNIRKTLFAIIQKTGFICQVRNKGSFTKVFFLNPATIQFIWYLDLIQPYCPLGVNPTIFSIITLLRMGIVSVSAIANRSNVSPNTIYKRLKEAELLGLIIRFRTNANEEDNLILNYFHPLISPKGFMKFDRCFTSMRG